MAQKKSTLLGDMVVGEVTASSENSREIIIKYPEKEGAQTFTGILADGYKFKLKDGSFRELKMNEITPGIRVRAFYKTRDENLGGQKTKINRIFRLDFLGKDEFVRLRNQLKVDPFWATIRRRFYRDPANR